MAIHHVSDKNPDGTLIGQSTTDKIGFFGLTTPIAQPSLTNMTTATATTTLNELRLNRITAVLVNLGLMVTADP